MIDHLKRLTDGIVNRTISSADIFGSYPEIYNALQELSPEQFEKSWQEEFTHARAAYRHLVHPNKHEVVDGTKVINAAKRLRPVLDHFIGPNPSTPKGAIHFNFTSIQGDQHVGDKITVSGNVTGSAVGSHASLKARNIGTQIQQSGLDNELKQKFAEAAEELAKLNIEEGDKDDAADDLKKLTEEFEKPTKDGSRITKIWNRIKAVAPTVATILASAVSVGKILGAVS
jgi:hypothetical protein